MAPEGGAAGLKLSSERRRKGLGNIRGAPVPPLSGWTAVTKELEHIVVKAKYGHRRLYISSIVVSLNKCMALLKL